jgi:hypothetical protein
MLVKLALNCDVKIRLATDNMDELSDEKTYVEPKSTAEPVPITNSQLHEVSCVAEQSLFPPPAQILAPQLANGVGQFGSSSSHGQPFWLPLEQSPNSSEPPQSSHFSKGPVWQELSSSEGESGGSISSITATAPS